MRPDCTKIRRQLRCGCRRIRNVARIITETYRRGHRVVAVLSAQGDTTDDLIAKAAADQPQRLQAGDGYAAVHRRADLLLPVRHGHRSSGVSCDLSHWLAGGDAHQLRYGSARIKRIRTDRIQTELDARKIVLVAGFQGINKYDDITTLGRGGSDTSAVALAASLHADLCQIYTDVDGVYTADPRSVTGARKLEEITYDEMLELASLGAQVLHNRSVEMAKRYNVNLEVLSSFTGNPGTKVKEVVKNMENPTSAVWRKIKMWPRLALVGLADEPGIAFKIFSLLAKKNINVDIILQSIGRDSSKDISFTVARGDTERAKALLEEHREAIGFREIEVNEQVAKVSIVGPGCKQPRCGARMFEALYGASVNINMISTSEIKVSVLVNERDADRAVQAIHDRFFNEFGGNA